MRWGFVRVGCWVWILCLEADLKMGRIRFFLRRPRRMGRTRRTGGTREEAEEEKVLSSVKVKLREGATKEVLGEPKIFIKPRELKSQ